MDLESTQGAIKSGRALLGPVVASFAKTVSARRRLVGAVTAITFVTLALVGLTFLRDTRPPCVGGDFGDHCRYQPPEPQSARRMSEDPSYALVNVDDKVVQLRWNTGLLMNPIGRIFGGRHSTLVATFASGHQVKIEKLGLGTVVYCPTIERPTCNMNSGDKYKIASGEFIKPTTWSQLHSMMVNDVEHYDVIDDNCHHAVQRVWNEVVVEHAKDHSPAPDNYLLNQWESFLRWWSSTDTALTDPEDIRYARQLAELRWRDGNENPSYDMAHIRRRRRRATDGGRCRMSKPNDYNNEDDPNCPRRAFSMSEGKSSSCDSECGKSCACHWWSSLKVRIDSDSKGVSDSSYKRGSCWSCGEGDYSGSSHWRWKSSASAAAESSHSDESHEAMPMDPRRDLFYGASAPGGDSEDSCSESGSEISHHSDGRSKEETDNVCGPPKDETVYPGGVVPWRTATATYKPLGTYMCEWSCNPGSKVVFTEAANAEWKCDDMKWHKSMAIKPGHTEFSCVEYCQKQPSCAQNCAEHCNYIKSYALNGGAAECMALNATYPYEFTMVAYTWDPALSTGAIILIICLIACECCCIGPCLLARGKGRGGAQELS